MTNTAPTALLPDPGIRPDDFATTEEFVDALVSREPSEEEQAAGQRTPTDLAITSGPDAWLAATYVAYRREANRPPRVRGEPRGRRRQ